MDEETFQGQYQPQLLQQQMQQMPQEEAGSDTGTEDVDEDVSQGSSEGGYSSFVQEILKGAPQEHVSMMEPYLKKFDAGVTRRFQDLQNQYKPYANLDWDEDTAGQMAEVYRVLNEEPERLYHALREQLELDEEEQNDEDTGDEESAQSFQGISPELQQRFDQQQQVLEALATVVLQGQQEQQHSIEDQEFDGYMDLLKQEFGNFDEKYVTMLIANGEDGEAAVKQYQTMVQELLNQAGQATEGFPNALLSSSGGGAVPQQEPQKLGQIPQSDLRNLIKNVITQANQAGQ
jgi:hypothetical protein